MDFDPAIAFYESALEQGRDAGTEVGWSAGQSVQIANFIGLCDIDGLVDGASLLDVGCGTGALLDHLATIGRRVEYTGIDISAKMIDTARARHPGAVFELRNILVDPPARRFDFVLCSGTLNYRIADHLRWVTEMLTRMYELADRAVVVNLQNATTTLSLRGQLKDKGEFVRFAAEDVVRFARRLTPDVEVHNAWSPTFEIVLRRPRTGALAALAHSLGVTTSDTPTLRAVIEHAWRRRLHAELRDLLRTIEPTPPILEHLAHAHLRLGEHEDAIRAFERAAALAPTRAEPCVSLGRLHFEARRDIDAQRWLREALVRDPDDPDARFGLVVSLARTGDRDGARAAALAAPPGALRELLDGQTSTDPEHAVAAFERALALAPRFIDALCAMATVYEQRRRWTDAIALWTRVLELAPENVAIRERLLRARRSTALE